MLLILDFDGVLFDGEKFKGDYLRIFHGLGIDAGAVRMAYQDGKSHAKGYHYVLMRRFARKLDPGACSARVASLLKSSPRYLYPDTKDFLRWCRSRRLTLVLLSTGPAFQKQKIAASGITPFFRKIVVIPDASKVVALRKIIRNFPKQRTIFVDDTPDVIDGIKHVLSGAFAIQMVRHREEKRSITADVRARNFADIAKILRA